MRVQAAAVPLLFLAASAFADFREFTDVPKNPALELAARHAAEQTLKDFPKLTAENLAISVIDVTKPSTIDRGDWHGDAPFYPASVVKLYIMAEVFHQKKESDPEIARALGEMIRLSDNDATAFLIDVISDTCPGPNLEGRALAKFIDKRRVANRWLATMGYDISAMAKPWSFGPFGREMQILGPNRINRNRSSANAFASLLLWIVRKRAMSPAASDAMVALLERPLNPPRADENQVKEFIGESLPAGSREWSKAGWTSEVRHDAAYVELPSGRKLILVIMTRGTADDVKLVPAIAKSVLAELQ
ncbi:MAG: class A beta-lactamase-related serine hydrolase [Acidobacteriota bacterium]|nr:class A beta-lactamase-related serine hydrolase [Acidobacteriota bacterium]